MYRCIIEENYLNDINDWFGPLFYNNKTYYIKDSIEKIKYALNVDISYPYLRDSPFRVKLPIVDKSFYSSDNTTAFDTYLIKYAHSKCDACNIFIYDYSNVSYNKKINAGDFPFYNINGFNLLVNENIDELLKNNNINISGSRFLKSNYLIAYHDAVLDCQYNDPVISCEKCGEKYFSFKQFIENKFTIDFDFNICKINANFISDINWKTLVKYNEYLYSSKVVSLIEFYVAFNYRKKQGPLLWRNMKL